MNFDESGQVQWWCNQNWLHHATVQQHTPSPLPWKTVMANAAQGHGQNKLNWDFIEMDLENDIWVYTPKDRKDDGTFESVGAGMM